MKHKAKSIQEIHQLARQKVPAPGMRAIPVVVFGHYDSRGGTSAYVMKERTEAEVARLVKAYNAVFEWEETIQDYKKNRESWAWDPTEEGSSPAESDFMFVADLWMPEGIELPDGGDLQKIGAVLIDTLSEPSMPGKPEYTKEIEERQRNDRNYDDPVMIAFHEATGQWDRDNQKWLRSASLEKPARLEFIPLEEGFHGWGADTDDDLRHEAIKAKLKVIGRKEAEVRDWDDDAFGFLLISE